jgi:hypothetical protein
MRLAGIEKVDLSIHASYSRSEGGFLTVSGGIIME